MAARFEGVVAQVIDGVVGEKSDVESNAGHDSAQVRTQQCTVVERLNVGECFDVGLDEVGELVKQFAAFLRPQLRPGGKRSAGGGDRGVDSVGITTGDFAQERPVNRRRVGVGHGGLDTLTVDEVAGVNLDTGNINRVHEHHSFGAWNRKSLGY